MKLKAEVDLRDLMAQAVNQDPEVFFLTLASIYRDKVDAAKLVREYNKADSYNDIANQLNELVRWTR